MRQFLPFFVKQRLFLKKHYIQLEKPMPDSTPLSLIGNPTSRDLKEHSIQLQFYSSYSSDQILKLLQFTEMIIFHTLILLMSSQEPIDQHDFKLYENEFYRLIKQDFSDESFELIYGD